MSMKLTSVDVYGTKVILGGCSAGIDSFLQAMERTESINATSRFKINQKVRVKDDITGIINVLMPTYDYYKARQLATYLVGKEVQIISPDKLYDIDGNEKLYYSISLDTGEFHILPEYLLEEL